MALAATFASVLPVASQDDSVTVVPGAQYAAGDVQRWLLGDGYRDLWVTPFRVEVLDLDTVGGGLTPVQRGGSVQTRALRFLAENGTEYNFRSVDKELTPALPPYAQETLLDWIRQDITSSQMPVAPIVATALLDAVGVLNPGPRLVVLPDDPALGEFREDFAGVLGTFEIHANEIDEGVGGFAGSVEVKGTDAMLDDVEDSPRDRVDARAFLTARLLDVLLGDFDRHEGQWRWARYDRGGTRWWVPVPEDRDYAFVHYDGRLLLAARAAGLARLVRFDESYPSPRALMANSLELNRRLLAELPRPAWDSIAAFVQSRLTDEVIAAAVDLTPPELQGDETAELEEKLRIRRDKLRAFADEYYRYMAEMVAVESTDVDESAEITRLPGGGVEVDITTLDGTPVYHRLFSPEETDEIRIDLHGGDDRALVRGAKGGISLRIMGGGGDDRLEDQARGPTYFYDSSGDNEFLTGPDTRVDQREYEPPEDTSGILPDNHSDWGSSFSFFPSAGWRSHAGVVVGGGVSYTTHGFRYDPRRSRHTLTALVAPTNGRGALEYRAELRRENSDRWLELRGEASTLDAVRFHGFGNERASAEDASHVWLRGLILEPRLHLPLSRTAEVSTGLRLKYTDPAYAGNSPVSFLRPFGWEPTTQTQAVLSFTLDTRDNRWFPRAGGEVEIEAAAAPPLLDIAESYSRLEGTASAFLPLPLPARTVLALRGGGAGVWGEFPFHEAAFLGGSHTLRGFQRERYAGDAMVFANAELRVPLTEMEIVVRGDLGVSGLVDVGRVWFDGESAGGWHHATGASLWFATPELSLSATWARGQDNRFYADIGLPF